MALIGKLEKLEMDRNSVHKQVEGTYSVFKDDAGNTFVQLDTYGSKERKLKGKKSQSLQLNEKSARALLEILRSAYR